MEPRTGPATFIADKTDTWEAIAAWSDLDVDELKQLNGAKGRLKSGQVVLLRPAEKETQK
jgi:LysM repeat protein